MLQGSPHPFHLVSKSTIRARNVQISGGAGGAQRIHGGANVAAIVVCNESEVRMRNRND